MFSKGEIVDILRNESRNEWLFNYADEIRRENVGDEIHLRALIEFSNICRCNCKYCGLRAENKTIERYRISPEEILEQAKLAAELGYKTVVLQSGEDMGFSQKILCDIIEKIKALNIALTLSIGERNFEDYKSFKTAGADRFLIRIETTDKNLYKKMHPNMDFENRIRCLKDLKELGYEVGTGCLVGLPGQTIDSLADDILFFKSIDADMIGIGPFLPHPQTPLKDEHTGSFTLALKVMALTRILLKDINIPATTAMETLHPDGRIIALQSGANVVMPNVTFSQYSSKYEIYPNKDGAGKDLIEYKKQLEEKFRSIGRTISKDCGFRGNK